MIAAQELQQEWMTDETELKEVPRDRDETIQSLLYLVQHIAGRLVAKLPSHVTKDDLISAGVVGLIDAVDRFEAETAQLLRSVGARPLLAQALVEQWRRRGAPDALAEARLIFEELGAGHWLERLDQLGAAPGAIVTGSG